MGMGPLNPNSERGWDPMTEVLKGGRGACVWGISES